MFIIIIIAAQGSLWTGSLSAYLQKIYKFFVIFFDFSSAECFTLTSFVKSHLTIVQFLQFLSHLTKLGFPFKL